MNKIKIQTILPMSINKQVSKGILHENAQEQAQEMNNYYKLHAKIYDSTRWTFLFGRREIIRLIPFERKAKIKILEVGCGTGYNLNLLAKRFPNATLMGIDVSADMIEKSRKATAAYEKRVQLFEMPYSKTCTVASEGVDVVLCSYSLTMINPQWQEVILKAKEDLNPGGVIAVTDFHKSKFPWFEHHMGNNHVRMDGHLLPFLNEHFDSKIEKEKLAYGGVWEYLVYVGKKQ